jgi:Domain of unknown function (DUF4276)
MAKYVIVPIVEGDGELHAVPVLLRNWLSFRSYDKYVVVTDGPVNAHGKGNLIATDDRTLGRGVEHFVRVAMLRQPQPDVVLILLDGDGDLPDSLEAALFARARTEVPFDFPIGVVVANRKYEAWFLAAFASQRFLRSSEQQAYRLKQRSLPHGIDVEAVSSCERQLESLIDFSGDESTGGQPARYKKTKHQKELTQILPFSPFMARRSPSFGRLLEQLEELLKQARRRRESIERRGPP